MDNKDQTENAPPKWAETFLLWFLKDDLVEEVLGDLEEQFAAQLGHRTPWQAKVNYWYQVFNYLRPFAVRKMNWTQLNPMFMFRHNMLLAFRNFKRYKSSFLINLIGLSTGLACAFLILMWVRDEVNFDKFHSNEDRLFQVFSNQATSTGINTNGSNPDYLARTMAEELPAVKYAVAVSPPGTFEDNSTLSIPGKVTKATGQFADKDYFQVFSFPLIQGDKAEVLKTKNSIVISERLALKIFNTTEDVVGESISWGALRFSVEMQITGIYENPPANSSFQADYVAAFDGILELIHEVRESTWGNFFPNVFIVLADGVDEKDFAANTKNFIKEKDEASITSLLIQPYSKGYLYSRFENGQVVGGRIDYVYLFSIIALFILFIACINFMNLSTAKATRRLKEIGVKKAIGASRGSLIAQYLWESILISLCSLLVAVAAVRLVLPQFNLITGKDLVFGFDPQLILLFIGITFFAGILAGSYPALYLSGFKPATILKGKINSSIGEAFARKGLVVFQFMLSIILIVSVLVVQEQVSFVQDKNLGYEKENILIFPFEGDIARNPKAFLTELRKNKDVKYASYSDHLLLGHNNSTSGINWEGKEEETHIDFENISVDYDFLELLDLEMTAGRTFSAERGTDDSTLIFNEAAIAVMGLEDPIGKTVEFWGSDREIIGVVKDFHFESLYEEVKPLVFRYNPKGAMQVYVKIEKGKDAAVIASVEKLYQRFNKGYSLDYAFMDANYQAQYISEQRVSILSRYFAGFAILISCMGLFGLAAFTAERRLKEIGIRKILGSSNFGIIQLLTKDFTRMVLIAILIALPLSYFLTQQWLKGFAFHTELKPWYFIVAGIAALVIAWLTVAFQTLRVANVNPASCLRD